MKMRKVFLRMIFAALLAVPATLVFAQDPPPPPGGGHGQGGNQTPGGSSPIGGGIAILLTLGAAYGAKRVYDARKRIAE